MYEDTSQDERDPHIDPGHASLCYYIDPGERRLLV